jgi:hypothetical protein
MDPINTIRAGIFLVAGLLMFFFPDQVVKLPNYVFKKLHIKANTKNYRKAYRYISILCFIIAAILLVYAMTH